MMSSSMLSLPTLILVVEPNWYGLRDGDDAPLPFLRMDGIRVWEVMVTEGKEVVEQCGAVQKALVPCDGKSR